MKVQLLTDGYQDNIKNIQFSKLGPFFHITDSIVDMNNIELQNLASEPRAPMFQSLVKFYRFRGSYELIVTRLQLYDIGLCCSLFSQLSFNSKFTDIKLEKVDVMETLSWWAEQKPIKEDFFLLQINSFYVVYLKNISFIETVWINSAQSAFFTIVNAPSLTKISYITISKSEIGSELFVLKNLSSLQVEHIQIADSIIKQAFLRVEDNGNDAINNMSIYNNILCQTTFVKENTLTKQILTSSYWLYYGKLNHFYFLNSCNDLRLINTNGVLNLKQQFDDYVSHSNPVEVPSSFFSIKNMSVRISES